MDLRKLYESEKEWVKFSYSFGQKCLAAQLFAKLSPEKYSKYFSVISKIIKRIYPERVEDGSDVIKTIRFNDHPNTTFEDVRVVLNAAQNELT